MIDLLLYFFLNIWIRLPIATISAVTAVIIPNAVSKNGLDCCGLFVGVELSPGVMAGSAGACAGSSGLAEPGEGSCAGCLIKISTYALCSPAH